MKADIKGAILAKAFHSFEHNGRKLKPSEARKILRYGIKKGYKYTSEITDIDVLVALRK